VSSKGDSQYGIYFDNTTSPNQYTLFKGETYATRDVSLSKVYLLPGTIEFSDLSVPQKEINFQKLSGSTEDQGSIALRLKNNTSQTKTLYISSTGSVSYVQASLASDSSRAKDSRHVAFDYTRQIGASCPTPTETINLYFEGSASPQKIITICDNLSGGELNWEGAVDVGGQIQTISLYGSNLGGSSAHFSIFRDRRFNTKSLRIGISSDTSGDLVQYPADGLTATYSSIYVSNFTLQ
jgi:hypothetical protein